MLQEVSLECPEGVTLDLPQQWCSRSGTSVLSDEFGSGVIRGYGLTPNNGSWPKEAVAASSLEVFKAKLDESSVWSNGKCLAHGRGVEPDGL